MLPVQTKRIDFGVMHWEKNTKQDKTTIVITLQRANTAKNTKLASELESTLKVKHLFIFAFFLDELSMGSLFYNYAFFQ